MTAFSPTFDQSRTYFEARLGVSLPARKEVSAKCLWHDDGTASMSVNLEKGRWFCHACNVGGGLLDFEKRLNGGDHQAAWNAIFEVTGAERPDKPEAKVYGYRDGEGNLAYEVHRFPRKQFRQCRVDANGKRIWNLEGTRRLLYNLPAILKSDTILIAEGEKDADTLTGLHLERHSILKGHTVAATCNSGGAGKWNPPDGEMFKGKEVVVFEDNDHAGRTHALDVLCSVFPHTKALKLIRLPGLEAKGDVSDWMRTHTTDELLAEMQAAPKWTPPAAVGDAIGLKLKRGTDIADREQRWLVQNFLPDDTLIVVAGQVGLGKTTACMDWAASITNGLVPIIGGEREARNVLMLSNEDSEAHLRRVFTRLGGNLSRLYVEDEDSDLQWGLGDIPALGAQIVKLRPALVIIDSLTTHKPSKVDLNSHGDVAPMLVALRKLAATHSCAVVVIHHTNKAQTNDPMAKISGSIGISATARHVILVAQHPENENTRVAAIAKSNLAKPGAQSYQFRLDPFAWHGETELRAEDLLQGAGDTENYGDTAEMFLRDVLKNGREDSAALARQGESGHGISRRTLQRAAKRLGVVKENIGYGSGRKVYWSLPSVIDDTISDIHTGSVADGAQSINLALFDAGSTISDTKHGAVADVSSMASSMNGESVFEVEL